MYQDMIAVTDRNTLFRELCRKNPDNKPDKLNKDFLCQKDIYNLYLHQLERIASAKPYAIVLREKDLPEDIYRKLAEHASAICTRYHVPLLLHSFVSAARNVPCSGIHLPLGILRETDPDVIKSFHIAGTSTHSVADALEAEQLGATYCFCGNIYETDCKKGLPGRGLSFLREVCNAVSIPVYAIGGIDMDKLPELKKAGAAGGCMMSGFMLY